MKHTPNDEGRAPVDPSDTQAIADPQPRQVALASERAAFRRDHVLVMASLLLVDLATTGVLTLVAQRLSAFAAALACSVAVFGVLGAGVAWRTTQPLESLAADEIEGWLRRLPAASAAEAVILTLLYCFVAFYLGVFFPDVARLEALPEASKRAASLWFATMYAALYGFYAYYAAADRCAELRARLAPAPRAACAAPRGRFVHRLLPVFLFLAVVPATLVGLDLGLFRDVRAAQGLTIEQTVLLDVIASLLVIAVSLYFVSRSLTRPVRLLAEAQARLEAGDLRAGAAVVSDDELGRLTVAFNRMVSGLRERERLRDAFERFTGAHNVVEAVIRDSSVAALAREATVLFTDIEGFSTLCEGLGPEETFHHLNGYVAAVAGALQAHGGTVNNFIGDSVMALFNLPQERPCFASEAVQAAFAVQRVLAERRARGAFAPPTRIGIATGPVHAGVIGDAARSAYTVYGHTVNLASRLEQANKDRGTAILVDARTRELAGPVARFAAAGETTLKGFATPCAMFSADPPA